MFSGRPFGGDGGVDRLSLPLVAYHYEQFTPWALPIGILLSLSRLLPRLGLGFLKLAASMLIPSMAPTWAPDRILAGGIVCGCGRCSAPGASSVGGCSGIAAAEHGRWCCFIS